jgi:uncharacterized membrane protein (DUF2068 family)
MAVTTWNTAPDYDEWGIDDSWDCNDWMQWHKLLKAKFGKEKAKYIWDYAYAQGTTGASHFDCRTFNTSFREYARKEGLDTYASAGIFAPVLDITGSGIEVVGGASNFVGSIGKNLKWLGWVAVGGVVIYAGFKIYKISKQ